MGLLRKLFCKEEPKPAPEPEPQPLLDTRPAYVPRRSLPYRQELTCVSCGKSEEVETYKRTPSGWKDFYGWSSHIGPVEVCPACRSSVLERQKSVEAENDARQALQAKRRVKAYKLQAAWDRTCPRPTAISRPEVTFIRRTTCGGCSRVVEQEGLPHKLPPAPEDWLPPHGRARHVVCPDCYAKFAPYREALQAWREERDLWIGGAFRAADEGLPPLKRLALPSRWRSGP